MSHSDFKAAEIESSIIVCQQCVRAISFFLCEVLCAKKNSKIKQPSTYLETSLLSIMTPIVRLVRLHSAQKYAYKTTSLSLFMHLVALKCLDIVSDIDSFQRNRSKSEPKSVSD